MRFLVLTFVLLFFSNTSHSEMLYGTRITQGNNVTIREVYESLEEASAACSKFVTGLGRNPSEWCGNNDDGTTFPGMAAYGAGWMCSPCTGNSNVDIFYLYLPYYCASDVDARFELSTRSCQRVVNVFTNLDAKQCLADVGNPINVTAGTKREVVPLGSPSGPLSMSVVYDSSPQVNFESGGTKFSPAPIKMWSRTFEKTLSVARYTNILSMKRGDGSILQFENVGGTYVYVRPFDSTKQLQAVADGWIYRDFSAGIVEKYDFNGNATLGRMSSVTSIDGKYTSLNYLPYYSLPYQIVDYTGRTIAVDYGSGTVPVEITWPDATKTEFAYDANSNLTEITWADATKRTFRYEKPGLPWALTSIVDEGSTTFSRFDYDSAGRASSTQHGTNADVYSVVRYTYPVILTSRYVYSADRGYYIRYFEWKDIQDLDVVGPSGELSTYRTVPNNGRNLINSQSQPAGSGCGASTKTQDYDANGNVAWKEDFKGTRTCYANDLGRNLETSRVEGLATGTACSGVVASNATLPAGSRKVSTSWHPVWRREIQVAEPRRLTTKVYNGQPDPFNNGAVASCAPSSAMLPDGSAIVVLCKQVEQATTDANGAMGLSATVDSTVTSRVQQWTYDQNGQMLTYTDPLSNVTTYAYYSDTTAAHTRGDLNTVTNAKQQVTTYTKYNRAGQWLEMKDANGVVTTRTFDLRQRLKTVTTAGITTTYDYWPTGLLKQVTLPDSSTVSYGYDDAHRLTSVTDNLGNSITYTLDNSGNRTGEDVKDPSGKLAKTLSRVPDALNRIQQVTGRE